MKLVRLYSPIVLFLVLFLGPKQSHAQYSEYEVKAAYLFNFAKFIEWPSSNLNADTIVLAIYKNDPFGIIIDKTMSGRKANNKIWKIVRTDNLNQPEKYHMVFFSEIQKYELQKAIEQLKNKPILTIGDEIAGFCEMGGVINFTPQYSENQFEINNDEAKLHRIAISPKLLLLAKIVSNDEDEF